MRCYDMLPNWRPPPDPLPSSPLVVTAAALAAPDAMHGALTCVEKSGSITLLVGSLNMSPALAQPED